MTTTITAATTWSATSTSATRIAAIAGMYRANVDTFVPMPSIPSTNDRPTP
jgi:hypothetical protein